MAVGGTLIATGDIVMTKSFADVPVDPAFERLREVLTAADLVLASVELPFSDRGHPSDRILNFRAQPQLLPELERFNLGLATVANNHSSDYGWEALAETVAGLRANGIGCIGAGEDLAAAQAPFITDIGGLRVGVIAWSCLLPLGAAAGPSKPGISPVHIRTAWEVNGEFQLEEPGVPPRIRTTVDPADEERILGAVRDLSERVDVAIVTIHWGYGFGEGLAEYQPVLGRQLIDAGADAVLGHHVHAPQGVEFHHGKPIIYSPGNFVAQQPREGASPEILAIYDAFSRDAFVSALRLTGVHEVDLELIPIRTNDAGLPTLAGPSDAERLARWIAADSERTATPDGAPQLEIKVPV